MKLRGLGGSILHVQSSDYRRKQFSEGASDVIVVAATEKVLLSLNSLCFIFNELTLSTNLKECKK